MDILLQQEYQNTMVLMVVLVAVLVEMPVVADLLEQVSLDKVILVALDQMLQDLTLVAEVVVLVVQVKVLHNQLEGMAVLVLKF